MFSFSLHRLADGGGVNMRQRVNLGFTKLQAYELALFAFRRGHCRSVCP
jgi:hypothetical protein